MNIRDFLTLLGTIAIALGSQLHVHGTTPAAFWFAVFCDTVGPLLVGSRALMKTPVAAPPTDPNATRKLFPLIAIFIGLSTLSMLTACAGLKAAWGTAESRHATVVKLESVALKVIGRAALASLQSLASDNGDFAHSAASAAWSSIHVSDLADVLAAAGATPQLATVAADITAKAIAGGVAKADALNAVASAISAGAMK